MFEGGKIYQHKSFRDVEMEVINTIAMPHWFKGAKKMQVRWRLKNGTYIGIQIDYVTVEEKDYSKWRIV